jgi:glucose-6-phosphate isomerase
LVVVNAAWIERSEHLAPVSPKPMSPKLTNRLLHIGRPFMSTEMPLLRLDCSDHSPPEPLRQSLEAARTQFLAENTVDFGDPENLCARLPPRLSFFALPEQQLLAYEQHRETSELGLVFQIANGLHDFIDAVVMVGSGGGCLGAKALAQACCDPFHNELTRAARGSKPRIYFLDSDSDNDRLQSLISRLAAGGYGDGPAEKRWAMIAADQPACSVWNELATDHLLQALRPTEGPRGAGAHGPDAPHRRLVTSIGRRDNPLADQLKDVGFDQVLHIPNTLEDSFSVLTPIGMLTAAFLGLDCIQLLVGAAAMNENFRNATFGDNLVLRYVAANQPRRKDESSWPNAQRGERLSLLWAGGLRGLADWCDAVQAETEVKHQTRLTLATETERAALLGRLAGKSLEAGDLVCNHLAVDTIRTDDLPVSPGETLKKTGGPPTVTDLKKGSIASTQRLLADAGIRQNRIDLPVIDTHTLGQFLQMMMLAAKIESIWEGRSTIAGRSADG